MIDDFYDNDADITAVLNGTKTFLPGMEPNKQACDEIEKYFRSLICQGEDK